MMPIMSKGQLRKYNIKEIKRREGSLKFQINIIVVILPRIKLVAIKSIPR